MIISRFLVVCIVAAAAILICSACHSQSTSIQPTAASPTKLRDVSDLRDTDKEELRNYLEEHGRPPVDYVVSQFADHDLVFLGESHQVRENCEFVADLLEPLYESGVHVLVSEFLRSRHTPKVDELLTAAHFDEAAAIDLFRDNPWPTWGFREYVEILEAAWKLNHRLPADAPRFRVVGMDSDWSQYALWFEIDDPTQVFQSTLAREKHMTEVLRGTSLDAGRKALVHVGFVHTVTCHGIYVATVLRQEYGQRIGQVVLHRNHGPGRERVPLTGLLEECAAGVHRETVGFDVIGSPFGSLVDRESIYSQFNPKLPFESFAEGYVILAPLEELHATRWIKGFINEEQFDKALAVATKMGWVEEGECPTPEQLDAELMERFP